MLKQRQTWVSMKTAMFKFYHFINNTYFTFYQPHITTSASETLRI